MNRRPQRSTATWWPKILIGLVLTIGLLPFPAASSPAQAAAPQVTGLHWNGDFLVADFAATGYDIEWTRDGQVVESVNDFAYAGYWYLHGGTAGQHCLRVRSTGAWVERCAAHIDPVTTSTTKTSIAVSWDSVTYDSTVLFLAVERNGTLVTTLPRTATSYTYTGLQEATDYTLGVYPVMNQGEHPRINNKTVRTAGDTTPPARPGWGRFWSQTSNSITIKWSASTDNVGVSGYRVRLGSGTRINLPATARTYTFANVAPGRHRVDVVAVDAAGNISAQRAAYQNVQSAAAHTATRDAVSDITAAIEAYAAEYGNFTGIGGYQGTGWFAYRNGTSYPEKISTTLINEGFLDAKYASVTYSDYMIYRCGSGDSQRVGVFGFMPSGTPVNAADVADWQGCTESAFYYGHHYYETTRTLGGIQSSDTTPPSRPGWGKYFTTGDASITVKWAASSDADSGVVEYRVRLDNGSHEFVVPASTLEHTFTGLAPKRYLAEVAAVDAAGNASPRRAAYLTVHSAATEATTRTAVDDFVSAIEAFGAANGNFTDIGGYRGTGWFAYRNGTSYPERINTTLIEAGFLDDKYASLHYSDYMVYQCGSGDDMRVGVFAVMADATPISPTWDGCTKSPIYYGHDHFRVTQRLGDLQVPDTTAPTRPAWNGNTFTSDSVTFNWRASTDDVGVVAYRAEIEGTDFEVTLPATARTHTFDAVAARTTRYVWRVTAIDAAGNESVALRSGFRMLSAQESAATVTAVDDVIAALEAFAADNGDFKAGAANGRGWFNYSNGTSYPTKMAANLVDGGYLDEQYRSIYYWDLMVYPCGSGDDLRVAVLSTADQATSAADQAAWSGCDRRYETLYGHDYYRVTRTLGEIQAAPVVPNFGENRIEYVPEQSADWTIAWEDSGDEYEFRWFQDDVQITTNGTSSEPQARQFVVKDGNLCFEVRAVRNGATSDWARTCRGVNPIPEIAFEVSAPQPSASSEYSPAHALKVSWPQLQDWPEVRGFEVWVDDSLVETVAPSEGEYLITGLTPGTSYEVGVYATGWAPFPGATKDRVVAATTQRGAAPPTQPALGAWAGSPNAVVLQWGYSDNGSPVAADDTELAHYEIRVDGQTLPIIVDRGVRTHTVNGLFPDSEVDVEVVAYDEDGNATASPVVTVTTPPVPPPPAVIPPPAPDTVAPIWGGAQWPQIQSVDIVQPGAVRINWCCALDFDQYNVVPASFDVFYKRASQPSSSYQLYANVPAYNTGGELVLSGLSENVEYSVLIVAIDWVGNRSEGLERDNVVPRGAPPGPEPLPIDGRRVGDPAPQAPPPPPTSTYTSPEPEPIFTYPTPQPTAVQDWDCSGSNFHTRSQSTSVQVQWWPLLGHDEYYVTAKRSSDNQPAGWVAEVDRPNATVVALEPETQYLITVSAKDLDGRPLGECTFGVETTELPQRPSIEFGDEDAFIADCLTVAEVNPGGAFITWDPNQGSFDTLRLRLMSAGSISPIATDTITDANGDGVFDRSTRGYRNLQPGVKYTVFLDRLVGGSVRDTACFATFVTPPPSLDNLDGPIGAWGLCGAAGGGAILKGEASTCVWINALGDVAVISGGQVSVGPQGGGSGSLTLGVADTNDLSSIGGFSWCVSGTGTVGGGITSSYCRGGFLLGGPNVVLLGGAVGVEVSVVSLGLSYGFVDEFDGDLVSAQDALCQLAGDLPVSQPAFCD